MGSMTTLFVIVGDIHGRFESLAEGLDEVRHRWGQFDFVLAVGDLEANRDRNDQMGVVVPGRYRKMGDFPRVVAGEIVLGAPLYFIAGNHDPFPMLDQTGPGEWAAGVWWLGRFGVTHSQRRLSLWRRCSGFHKACRSLRVSYRTQWPPACVLEAELLLGHPP